MSSNLKLLRTKQTWHVIHQYGSINRFNSFDKALKVHNASTNSRLFSKDLAEYVNVCVKKVNLSNVTWTRGAYGAWSTDIPTLKAEYGTWLADALNLLWEKENS
jgi:hypothetical protein